MRKVRILVQVSHATKAKLDALRAQGTTASGFIRSILERGLGTVQTSKKGR